jgi:hypothetical protein
MKNIILAFLMLFIIAGCKKNISDLPAPSQTGANIFGAKVNGALWVPRGYGIASTAPTLEARFSGNNSIVINARNFGSEPIETEFELFLYNVADTGTIMLNQNTTNYPNETASYGYYIKRNVNPLGEWITNAAHMGRVVITRLDRANKIISGTFDFQAGSMDNTADPINVTEGRFDVTIQ